MCAHSTVRVYGIADVLTKHALMHSSCVGSKLKMGRGEGSRWGFSFDSSGIVCMHSTVRVHGIADVLTKHALMHYSVCVGSSQNMSE